MATPQPRPHPNTRPCAECGHVWFAGERQHVYVGAEDDENAEVICLLCQRVREREERGSSMR